MKPTRGPSIRQILTYDISSQRFGIFSLFLVIPSLVILIIGLFIKAYNFAWIGFGCFLFSVWLIARLLLRIRLFQRTYENGESVNSTVNFVSAHGDEINVSGEYTYRMENYGFSTTIQKTGRTIGLTVGDQVWLVVDQDNPKNLYIQELYTPDSPEETQQADFSSPFKEKEKQNYREVHRIEVSGSTIDNQYHLQPIDGKANGAGNQSGRLTVHDFQFAFLLGGIIFILIGIFTHKPAETLFLEILGLISILIAINYWSTIIVDKNAGIMRIESKIWKRKQVEISLNELRDIQIDATEGADDTMYRLVAIKKDGTAVPLQAAYKGGLFALDSCKKRALKLRKFIGLGSRDMQN